MTAARATSTVVVTPPHPPPPKKGHFAGTTYPFHLQHAHVDAVVLLRLSLETVPVLHAADVLLLLRKSVLHVVSTI